jgi:hypothetical protein
MSPGILGDAKRGALFAAGIAYSVVAAVVTLYITFTGDEHPDNDYPFVIVGVYGIFTLVPAAVAWLATNHLWRSFGAPLALCWMAVAIPYGPLWEAVAVF